MKLDLLILLCVINFATVISVVTKNNHQSTSASQHLAILPLIMIQQDNILVPPDYIDTADTNENGEFTAKTIFQRRRPGNQIFFCGQDSPSQPQNIQDQHCSYSTTFEPTKLLQCPKPPDFYVGKIASKNGIIYQDLDKPCGLNNEGKLYWFAYKACTLGTSGLWRNTVTDRNIIEVFRFCYVENKGILFTEHDLLAPKLLADQRMNNEKGRTYDTIIDGYGVFDDYLSTLQQAYDELHNETDQDRIEDDTETSSSSFLPQKLVPSEDMTTALLREPTFHLLNTQPMREDLLELWNHISELIRKDAIETNWEYKIFTGVASVTNKSIPDIWVKIVRSVSPARNDSLIIIFNNNAKDDVFEGLFKNSNCKKNLCENSFKDEFPGASGSVRCCVTRQNPVLSYFNLQDEYRNDIYLRINSFTTEL